MCFYIFPVHRKSGDTVVQSVYDRLVEEDVHFHSYVDHHETIPFDDIVLYSKWLTSGSRLTSLYLPECVMRQFGYMQYIPKDSYVSAPPSAKRIDMNAMFGDYVNHLVPDEAQNIIVEYDWSYVDGYI
ncbi:uncharacterized protein LOC131658616 [Vicia villosa]|uniref:uncharacterized protein LOC131658616 n=1 Tax=Vicia villosa TaxID=3911 RepID=UPI00273A81BF|nr:uncharacterized protein LOC131658616 [Vicia villosa]